MSKRIHLKALALPTFLIAVMSFCDSTQAADLPRANVAKPLERELGRDLACCDGPKADLRLRTLGGDPPGDGRPNAGFCGSVVGTDHTVAFSVVKM